MIAGILHRNIPHTYDNGLMQQASSSDLAIAIEISTAAILGMPGLDGLAEWAAEFAGRLPGWIEKGQVWLVGQRAVVVRDGFWVEAIFVMPQYQRTGIGTEIAGELRRQAKAEGLEYLEGHANPTALGFYQRLGMEDLGMEHVTSPTGLQYVAHRMRMRVHGV